MNIQLVRGRINVVFDRARLQSQGHADFLVSKASRYRMSKDTTADRHNQTANSHDFREV